MWCGVVVPCASATRLDRWVQAALRCSVHFGQFSGFCLAILLPTPLTFVYRNYVSNENYKIQFLRLNVENGMFFINSYPLPNINIRALKAEMDIAKLAIQGKKDSKNVLIYLKNSVLKPIVPILTENILKNVYPNLYRLMCIAFTLPSNSATCERTFSTMRRISNWLRSTINQERLSDLMVLFSESDIVKNLDYQTIANTFLSKGGRK